MATMAAVDLGAQSGRVAVGRFDGERLSRGGAPFPERAGRARRDAPLGRAAPLRGRHRRAPRGGARRPRSTRSRSTRGRSTSGSSTAPADSLENPVHYRDARRARAVDGVFARVPARELYERTGIQLMPINTVFELAAMAAEADPALEAAEHAAADPDLFHYWLCGSRTTEFTNATTTQCFDPRAGGWAADLLDRLGIPTALASRRSSRRGHGSARSSADVAERRARGADVVAVATHDTGSAVAAVPFREAGSAFLSVGTWSLVGLEVDAPRDQRRAFAANLTNEGGVAGTFRLLRNVTGLWLLDECRRALGRGGQRAHVRRAGRARRRTRRRFARFDRPERRGVRSSPATCRRACASSASRPASPSPRPGRDRPLHPREPGAQARRDGRLLRDGHAARRRASSTSSAAGPATGCSARGPRAPRACPCSQARRRRRCSATCSSRRWRSARSARSPRRARSFARRSSRPSTSRPPPGGTRRGSASPSSRTAPPLEVGA